MQAAPELLPFASGEHGHPHCSLTPGLVGAVHGPDTGSVAWGGRGKGFIKGPRLVRLLSTGARIRIPLRRGEELHPSSFFLTICHSSVSFKRIYYKRKNQMNKKDRNRTNEKRQKTQNLKSNKKKNTKKEEEEKKQHLLSTGPSPPCRAQGTEAQAPPQHRTPGCWPRGLRSPGDLAPGSAAPTQQASCVAPHGPHCQPPVSGGSSSVKTDTPEKHRENTV